jgi:hypothetical protein
MLITILICGVLGGVLAGAVGLCHAFIAKRSGEPRAKKWRGVLGGVAAGLAVTLGPLIAKSSAGRALEVALGLKHRSEVVMEDVFRRVLEHATVRQELKGKSKPEAEAYTARLAREGILRLDEARLGQWAELRARMAQVSPGLCSAMWKGGIDSGLVLGALRALPEEEVRQWAEVSAHACLLTLEQPSSGPSSTSSLGDGLAEIVAELPPSEGQAFVRDAANPALTDQRACELVKSMFDGARRLAPPRRIAFYRALASTS